MASKKREFENGGIYHIYNRGNHKERVFHHAEDYIRFLMRLHEYAERDGITVLAYCVMTNHYHLLVKQNSDKPVSAMMRSLGVSYAKYFNWQYQAVGHVYQGRYGSRAINDTADLANIAKYIHHNPASFTDPFRYRWSDLHATCSSASDPLLATLGWSRSEYKTFCNNAIKNEVAQPTSKVTLIA